MPATQQPPLTDASLLWALFQHAPVGITLFDTRLRYWRVNPAQCETLGWSGAELLGRTPHERVPDLAAQLVPLLQTVLSTGLPERDIEIRGRTRAHDGAERTFSVSCFRIQAADGQVAGVAAIVIDSTERTRAQEASELANQRLALLNRASIALVSSLDPPEVLRRLAELTVPRFADHCVVDLVEPDGTLRRAATRHAPGVAVTPGDWAGDGEVVIYPPGHPTLRAISARTALRLDAIPDQHLDELSPTPRSADFARRLQLRSLLCIPLVAGETVLGAANFLTSLSGRSYDDADTAFAEALAGRAAVALDNARLFARERDIALTLQRSLLSPEFPQIDGLELASHYLPGTVGTEVGGDWFDVIPLPCSRVGLVIGDVMGRGLRAAAVIGQLRAAVRAFATLELSPEVLLDHLDDLVASLDQAQIATCSYAVYDPGSRRLALANAGHLPPILLPADGPAYLLTLEPGVPLGVGGFAHELVEIELAPGAGVVFYTDGLVEHRGSDLLDGVHRLAAQFPGPVGPGAGPTDTLSASCEAAVRTLLSGTDHDDDVALLAVRVPPTGGTVDAARLDLPLEPRAAGMARQFTAEHLRYWGTLPAVADVACLLVSELVTNAVRHGGSLIGLRLLHSTRQLSAEIADGDARLPHPCQASADDEGGRGLALVAALATRWGTRRTRDGKVVWFELTNATSRRGSRP